MHGDLPILNIFYVDSIKFSVSSLMRKHTTFCHCVTCGKSAYGNS